MEKTGIGLLEILALVAILLPLIPVFIIFISRSYKQDTIALLMVLCLVSFIQNLILYIPRFVPLDILFIRASFQVINFIILGILMHTVIEGRSLKEALKILLVALVSVIVTIYSTGGIAHHHANIELVQALVMVLITLVALFQIIRNHDIFIFHSPLFWIAGGTFFYYSMFLLTQSIPEYKAAIQNTPEHQRKILLLVITLVQFIFYIVASVVAGNKTENDQMLID